jgi:hypothetical protein
VRRPEWEQIVDAARAHAGDEKLPIWSALVNYYSVCVPSVVTELSFKLWHLHQRIGGTRNETYASYNDLPAFWVDACMVIDAEIARIDKVRADKAQREQRELLRRIKQGK